MNRTDPAGRGTAQGDGTPSAAPLLYAALSLTTLVVLLLELTLTRLFSVILWYHFAFMAISLALFGSAASGIAVYLVRERLPQRLLPSLCAACLLAFAGSLTGGLAVLLSQNLQPTVSWEGFRSLLLVYGLTSVPFFFAGAAIALVVTFQAAQ